MAITDIDFLENLSNPVYASYRKRGFFWSDLRTSVVAADEYYYSFVFSSQHHTVIYGRNLSAGEGPVEMNLIVGATYTPGTLKPAFNLYLGAPAPDLVVTRGVTGVAGGASSLVEYAFGAGNNSAVAGSGGQPTIFPPGAAALVKLTNHALGTNPGILLQLAFVETEIPDNL